MGGAADRPLIGVPSRALRAFLAWREYRTPLLAAASLLFAFLAWQFLSTFVFMVALYSGPEPTHCGLF